MRAHPYFQALPIDVNDAARIHIWTMLRVTVPGSTYYRHQETYRIYSQPPLGKQAARADPILYLPTNSNRIRVPESESLHGMAKEASTRLIPLTITLDYLIGRVALLFSLAPSTLVPEPQLMAYVQRFTPVPRTTAGASGFYAVAKARNRGTPRYEVIAASQIARPCPLSPIIEGRANRAVTGHASLDHYDRFYINKYRTPRHFSFIHSI